MSAIRAEMKVENEVLTVGILVDYILDPASDIRILETSVRLGLFNSFDADAAHTPSIAGR